MAKVAGDAIIYSMKHARRHDEILKLAAIVTVDIHEHHKPILYAARGVPVEPEDSGWQFHATAAGSPETGVGILWDLAKVIEYEPSLAFIVNLPMGSSLSRRTASSP